MNTMNYSKSKYMIGFSNPLFILFLFFPFIKPSIIAISGVWNNIFNFMRVISFLILLYYHVKRIRYKSYHSKLLKSLVFLYLVFFISTLLGSQNFNSYIYYLCGDLGIVLFFIEAKNRNTDLFLRVVIKYIFILCFLNLVLGIVDVSTDQYLLGIRTTIPFYYIALLAMIDYYNSLLNKKWSYLQLGTFLLFIIEIISKSLSTGLIMLSIYIVIYLFRLTDFKYLNRIAWFICVLIIMINAYICLNGIPSSIMEISVLLGEGTTFNGRLAIWEKYVDAIRNSFIGYGIGADNLVIGQYISARMAHNQFLDYGYKGGYAAIFLFIYIFFNGFKSEKEHNRFVFLPYYVAIMASTLVEIPALFCIIYGVFELQEKRYENDFIKI